MAGMILYGPYDSPFVRRVAIVLHLHEKPFEQRAWSSYTDFGKLLDVHPLGTVPVLQLGDHGDALPDSRVILDFIESIAPRAVRLLPQDQPYRHRAMAFEAIALNVMEKAVALQVERQERNPESRDITWEARLAFQIGEGLEWLERHAGPRWLCGPDLTLGDITTAVLMTFLEREFPELLTERHFPRLLAHTAQSEALPAFRRAPYPEKQAAFALGTG